MRLNRPQLMFSIGLILLTFVLGSNSAFAAPQAAAPTASIASEHPPTGMTVWDLLKAGGFIMVVLAALSLVTIAIIIYNFRTLKIDYLVPIKFSEELIQSLEQGDEKAAILMCQEEENIISNVMLSGLAKKNRGSVFVREAMENSVRHELTSLWQNISYLADIGAIAPLIGLLGSVLGMISVFNNFAFHSGTIKPAMLVGGVSQAMVVTAGGLVIAIPAFLFYSFFKGRVQEISNVVESYSTEIIKIVEQSSERR